MRQHELPFRIGQRGGIVVGHGLHRGLGRRQRARDRFREAIWRNLLTGGDAGHQGVPALLAAVIALVAGAHVLVDAARRLLVPGTARDGDGARAVPEAQRIERLQLELGHRELVDVGEVVGIDADGFEVVGARLGVVLGLQRREAQRAVEDRDHLHLHAHEVAVGDGGRLGPFGQGGNPAFGGTDSRRKSGRFTGHRPGASDIGAIGQRAHIVGIDLQHSSGGRVGLGRIAGALPCRHGLLIGIDEQNAAGVPGDEHFHRLRPLGRVLDVERLGIGGLLGRVLHGSGRLRARTADRDDERQR